MSYIFIDIDGTLYSKHQDQIPTSAIEAMKLAKRNGHKVFLCTGRSKGEALPFLNLPVDGFAFSSGAYIEVNSEVIYAKEMEYEQCLELVHQLNEHQLGYCLSGNLKSYSSPYGMEFIYRYFSEEHRSKDEVMALIEKHNFFVDQNFKEDFITKINIYSYQLDAIYNFGKHVDHSFDITVFINENSTFKAAELTFHNHSKATAVSNIMRYFGSKDEIVCIGDSENDIPMFQIADIAIGMKHGSSEALKHVSYITDDVLEDGIYKAFKHFDLI